MTKDFQTALLTVLVAIIVVICATVAAALDVLSGEALAGIYGAVVGGGAVAVTPLGRRG